MNCFVIYQEGKEPTLHKWSPKVGGGGETYQVRTLLNPILKVLGQQFGVRFTGSGMHSTNHTHSRLTAVLWSDSSENYKTKRTGAKGS